MHFLFFNIHAIEMSVLVLQYKPLNPPSSQQRKTTKKGKNLQ